jgi:hypothetical protein
MHTPLIFLVIIMSVLVLVLLAVVAVGIHREPPSAELSTRAPSLTAGLARRMVGLYICRPDPPTESVGTRDTCLTGHATRREGGVTR